MPVWTALPQLAIHMAFQCPSDWPPTTISREGVRLNITARMMAVQAPQNWTAAESEAFFTRHFFRALFQRILLDRGVVRKPSAADDTVGGSPREWSGEDQPIIIGSLRKNCYASFTTYVRGAVAKLAEDPKRGQVIAEKVDCLQMMKLRITRRHITGRRRN
jgi:hypothetical protein